MPVFFLTTTTTNGPSRGVKAKKHLTLVSLGGLPRLPPSGAPPLVPLAPQFISLSSCEYSNLKSALDLWHHPPGACPFSPPLMAKSK